MICTFFKTALCNSAAKHIACLTARINIPKPFATWSFNYQQVVLRKHDILNGVPEEHFMGSNNLDGRGSL